MSIAVAQAVVNAADFNGGAGGTTVVINVTVINAGATLAVFVTYTSTSETSAVADNVNAGAYTGPVSHVLDTDEDQTMDSFYKTGCAAGATTVTATLSASLNFRAIWVVEISGSSGGADGGHGQDQTGPGTGANAISSGNMTNASQPALIVGVSSCQDGSSTLAAGTGFTSNLTDSSTSSVVESKRITSTGSTQAATWTDATNGGGANYLQAALIFDEATAGGSISGTSAGTGAASAALVAKGALAGTPAGVATASATLAALGALAGSGTGVAAATATGQLFGRLTGASTGAATATATPAGTAALVGASAGVGSAAATAQATAALAGTSAGVAGQTGTLHGFASLAGTIAGASSATATLSAPNVLSGTIAGTSTATATVQASGAMAAVSSGTAIATAAIGAIVPMAGTSAGAATSTAVPSAFGALAGSVPGATTTTGSLGGAASVLGTSTSSSTTTGTLTVFVTGEMLGASHGTSTATAALEAILPPWLIATSGTQPTGASGARSPNRSLR